MALDTYANLKESVQDWSHRNDVKSRLDDFILIAEQEMYNNPAEPLEAREQEVKSFVDTVKGVNAVALPAGYQSMRSILIDDKSTDAQPYQLSYTTPELLRASPTNGCPTSFTVTSLIEFNRPADAIYNIEINHLAKIQALTAANPTNSILTNYPTIYLSGCLWALYEWAKDGESAAASYAKFIGAIQAANLSTQNGKYGPAPVMRSEGWVV
mgnify:CR=1 FL=1